jgi:hypothetical protein
MRKKTLAVSAIVFSSALVIGHSYAWSQSSSGTEPYGAGPEEKPRSGASGSPSSPSSGMSGSSSSTGSSSMGSSSASGQWSNDDIKKVQQALKEKGYDPGAVDGVMSPRTQQALRQFQQAQKIQATGQLDSQTASALGISPSSASRGSSSSPVSPGARSSSGSKADGATAPASGSSVTSPSTKGGKESSAD